MGAQRSVFEFDSAIVRAPGHSVVHGLSANSQQAPPSYAGVLEEHRAYISALRSAGVNVLELPPLEAFPDSIFVEDPALVFTDAAILLRPGAESRQGEAAEILPVLKDRFSRVCSLRDPGFADGGDVLLLPSQVMIGLSARTTSEGAEALSIILADLGQNPRIVETPPGVLHFKTDCALLDDRTVLTTERLADAGFFQDYALIVVPAGEEAAANALRVNDVVFLGDGFPKTAARLTEAGYRVVLLPTTEIGKIDAGLSCMSLRWHQ